MNIAVTAAHRAFDRAEVRARNIEQRFAERGTWLLLSSRFLPGTRLPTYLAAGFLRLSFARFLAVTGTAVACWTVGIFVLANEVGPELLSWLRRSNSSGWAILLVIVAFVVAIRLTNTLAIESFRRRFRAAMGRWTR